MIGAVDIGGTKIAVGMVDGNGRILSRAQCDTDARLGFPHAIQRIASMLQQVAESARAPITGIGIGCTGPVYPLTGRIGNVDFLPGWEGADPVQELSHAFRVPVAMENDADAVALGEAFWGAGKGKRNLICVTVGTGIGGGIILDGKLYRGVDDSHPEVGHHVIDAAGPKCFCGACGCWEVLARGPAVVEWFIAQAPDYPDKPALTAKRICEMARQGDALASRAVAREACYLGLGLANLITLFSPDMVVLGGSVMGSAPLFWDDIKNIIRQNCGLVPFEKTELKLASLGPDTPLMGAARVWHHRFAQMGG